MASFVVVLIAKVSQGRTICRYVLGALFIPATVIVGALTIIRGTAIWFQRTEGSVALDGTAASMLELAEIFGWSWTSCPGGSGPAAHDHGVLGAVHRRVAVAAAALQCELADDALRNRARWQRAAAEQATMRGLVKHGMTARSP